MAARRAEHGAGTGGGDEGCYAIGALAAEFALTPRTIRYYEDQGLLAPGREGMQRVYGARDRARLALICRGKRLGFSLAEIRDFLGLYDVDDTRVEQARYLLARAREREAALERQARDLQDTLADLRAMIATAAEHLRRHGFEDSAERATP